MSQRNRFAYAALGLVAGLGIALLFLVWSVPGFRYPADNEIRQQYAEPPQAEGNDRQPVAKRIYWGLFTADDTLAQWMMAVFSIVATGASIYAVILLRDTLAATRDAVRSADDAVGVTREIGQAQVRAYVKCSKVECKLLGQNETDDVFTLIVETQNLGQSPAMEMQVIVGIEFISFENGAIARPLQINARPDPAIAPQGVSTAILSFGYDKGAADVVRKSEAYLRFTVAYVYKDVFGKQTELITYHHTEGSLLDSGMTASHIVGVKPQHRPK